MFPASTESVKGLFKWHILKGELKIPQFNKVLYNLFTTMCSQGNPMTAPMIIEKLSLLWWNQINWQAHIFWGLVVKFERTSSWRRYPNGILLWLCSAVNTLISFLCVKKQGLATADFVHGNKRDEFHLVANWMLVLD